MMPCCPALLNSRFMVVLGPTSRFASAGLALLAIARLSPQSIPAVNTATVGPSSETLSYSIEWRLINAGTARMSLSPQSGSAPQWESKLHLESGGLVAKLYKLNDNYRVQFQDQFCATDS